MSAPHQATPAELKARIEAERAGAPFLYYFDGEGRQRLQALEGRPLTIGRDADADLCLDWDGKVSRLHAELHCVGGHWLVADEGLSRNGTFVNEERVAGRRRLADQDVIRVGGTAIVHRVPGAARQPSTLLDDATTVAAEISPAQRRVLVALCRPFAGGDAHATPATNPQIATELYLTVAAVKTHLRVLFHKFGIEELPQQDKRRRLVAMAFASGLVSERELREG